MTNPFKDQKKFMEACDQTVDKFNRTQFEMYVSLIAEEYQELHEAISAEDEEEILDALLDIVVVTIGAMHSLGVNGEGGWQEVMRTNFAKVDPVTGKVNKREDGKVLKPAGWQPPNLKPYVHQ